MLPVQPAPMAFVQPTKAPTFNSPCTKPEATLIEVTNLLNGQQIMAGVADGTPCCYKGNDGKRYSSVYKDDQCQASTALLCFRPVSPADPEAWLRVKERSSGRYKKPS